MKSLSKKEIIEIQGGSQTVKKIAAWLKEQWCAIKSYEAPEKTWSGNGNHVWL